MFWRKKSAEEKGKQKKKKPPDLISGSVVWTYMLKQYGLTPDILFELRRVETDCVVGDKAATMIRIFDPATASGKGIAIGDYQSLDDQPELILYEGYYREVGGQATDIRIEKK